MQTRENIREKVLAIPFGGCSVICSLVVHYESTGYTVHDTASLYLTKLNIKEAVRAVFDNQPGQTPTQPTNASPTKS